MSRSIVCAFVALAHFTLASPATAQQDDATRTFRPRFAEAGQLNALLRGVVDVRKSAVNERDQSLTIRGSSQTIRAAAALIDDWDKPAPRWRARLVAVTATKEEVLRDFWLEDEKLEMKFKSSNDWLSVRLEARDLRERSLALGYTFDARLVLPQGRPTFGWEEKGAAALSGDGEQVVVRAASELQREALAALVGASRPVKEVVLRLAPNR